MKTKANRKTRLYGKHQPRMPMPKTAGRDKGFSLRTINEADSRFAVVKDMRRRLEKLKDESDCDTLAREALAGRAIFLLVYLESCEIEMLEGRQIDWKRYLTAAKALADLLSKLGL